MIKLILVVAIAGSAAIACGTSPLPAGAECKQTTDCESTLDCLDVAMFTGSACSVVAHTCSVTCTGATDTSCKALGSNFTCFAGCGSQMTCGAIGP